MDGSARLHADRPDHDGGILRPGRAGEHRVRANSGPSPAPSTTITYWKHERYWKLSEILHLDLFSGTPFKGFIWRLLGVKVGRKLFDDGSGIPEKMLVSIGDNCTINQTVTIQGHSLEDGAFKSDYIRIGDGCTIGCNAFVHYGVEMEDNVVLEPDSLPDEGRASGRQLDMARQSRQRDMRIEFHDRTP